MTTELKFNQKDFENTRNRIRSIVDNWLEAYSKSENKEAFIQNAIDKGFFESITTGLKNSTRDFKLEIKLKLKDVYNV